MKFLKLPSLVVFLYFSCGFLLNQYEVSLPVSTSYKMDQSADYDYRGVINISSKLSIGSSDYSQILKSAEKAGLDFLMFTDLNTFSEKTLHSSYQGEILALIGSKYSYLDSRLIFYSSKEKNLGNTLGEVQTNIADIITKNPSENKDILTILTQPKTTGFAWQGDLPPGIDGMEILNSKSISSLQWAQNKLSVIWSLLIYPFNSRLSLIRLFREPEEETKFWDAQTLHHRVNAYAGNDATARAIPFSGYLMKFPSYLRSFELMSNHVLLTSELTGNFENDKKKIFRALKEGRFYLSFDLLGNPKGFSAVITSKQKKYPMGSQLDWSQDLELRAQIPEIKNVFFEILLIHNGKKILAFNTHKVKVPLSERGVYRVQVRVSPRFPLPDGKKWISWIYSNPFYVR